MTDLTIRPVDPGLDAPLLHGWVTHERAEFWGMRDKDLEEVAWIYGYIRDQPHLSADLVEIAGEPVALFQTWDPVVDELGEAYDRQPGDLGVHLLLADTPTRRGRTREVVGFFVDGLLARPGVRRLVLEPDARNAKSLHLLGRLGAEPGPVVELPHKTAQFCFLSPPSCRPAPG